MSAHIGDDAELWALGMLEPEHRAAFEQHVADCADCRARATAAEGAAFALAAALPLATPAFAAPPPPIPLFGARSPKVGGVSRASAFLAAAAVVALGIVGSNDILLRNTLAGDDGALHALTQSHFEHRSFAVPAGEAMSAKVLYAKDRSWLYVLVDHPVRDLHVIATIDGSARDLGHASERDGLATLFVHPQGSIDRLELRSGNRHEGWATLRPQP